MNLTFAVYTQSAEMVRTFQLGIGNTFPLQLLHRILIRGQLTAKEEIALGSAGQTALNEPISKGFVQGLTARQTVNTPPHAGLTSNLSNLITVRRR